jgi:hypothetical protein
MGYFTVFWTPKRLVVESEKQAAIHATFDLLVAELRKTSMLPNIQDNVINAPLSLTQGSMRYALYTQQFNDFLRFTGLVSSLQLKSSVFGSSMAWLTLS